MALLQVIGRTRFWSIYRQQLQAGKQRDSLEGLKPLLELLKHAQEHVPFWKDRVTAGMGPGVHDPERILEWFTRLPVCSKQDLRSGFPDLVTSQRYRNQWRYGSSSGTVDRVTIVNDFRKRDYIRATNLRVNHALLADPLAARIVEVPPDACNVVCALRDEGPIELFPYMRWALSKGILFKKQTRPDLRGRIERKFIVKQQTLEPISAGSYEDLCPQLDRQLDRIQCLRPNILRGLPLFLLWLAERATDRELKFEGLRFILPYGGLMSDAIARRVSLAFGVPFVDYYGTSEVGGIALGFEVSDKQHRGLEVFDDLVLVEVLDEQNQPLPPGRTGKVVITDFYNFAMPLIRYEIGDCGKWLSEGLNTCNQFELNRSAKLQVVGRDAEILNVDDRSVSPREVMDIVFADPSIINARLESRRVANMQKFSLTYVGRATIDVETQRSLESLLQVDQPIAVRKTSYLRPEASGKYLMIKVG